LTKAEAVFALTGSLVHSGYAVIELRALELNLSLEKQNEDERGLNFLA
jgi:hypothetical protein